MKALKLILVMALVAAAALAGACGQAPKVVQGTVVSFQADSKTMVIKDLNPPNSEMTFSVEGADVGANSLAGDVVRVAYHDKAGQLTATRVMNLTRQDEKEKKSSHH